MTNTSNLLCPAPDMRHEDAQPKSVQPLQALTHDEQIAEYVRIVEEARMRT